MKKYIHGSVCTVYSHLLVGSKSTNIDFCTHFSLSARLIKQKSSGSISSRHLYSAISSNRRICHNLCFNQTSVKRCWSASKLGARFVFVK